MKTVLMPKSGNVSAFGVAIRHALSDGILVVSFPSGGVSALEKIAEKYAGGGVLFATSGTIGDSKLVVRSEESVVAEANGVAQAMGLTSASRVLITSPVYHSYGFGILMACAVVGATAIAVSDEGNVFSRINQARSLLTEGRFDAITGVPFIFRRLMREPLKLPSSTVSYAGGEVVPPNLTWQWREHTGSPLCQEYGLSEVGIVSLASPYMPSNSIGKAVPGCRVAIDSDGELIVFRDGNPVSYLRGDSEETFESGGVRTGDLGYLDDSGLLYLTGRKKSVIFVGGNNVVPEEIEAVVRSFSAVEEVVVKEETRRSGETGLVAHVSPALSDEALSYLGQLLREKLPAFKVPRLVTTPVLPRTDTGKVNRHGL